MQGEISNNSDLDVVEVLMPRLGGIVLGGSFEDDAIIYPHHAGERTRDVVRGYGVNKKDLWRASSKAFEDFYRREIQLLRAGFHELDVLL